MLTSMFLVTALLAQAQAPAPTPETVPLGGDKGDFRVLTDGKKHFIVYNAKKPLAGGTFYGDGKTMAKLRVFGGGGSEDSWEIFLWDPRFHPVTGGYASIALRETQEPGEHFVATCGKKVTTLKPLEDAEASKLLSEATFIGPTWDRMPERLLRDDSGKYYLVDRLRTEDRADRRDFRLFIGPRGKLKLTALKDVVDDSAGMIFSTQAGELRLVANAEAPGARPTLRWIAGKQKMELTEVPLDNPQNARMTYIELGPYVGARIGTPCDDLL